MTLSWYPAYDGNSPILSYMVRYRDMLSHGYTNTSVAGTITTTTITGLSPHTEYQVQVFSGNSVGLGSPTKMIRVTTEEEAPSGPPQSVRVEPVSSTELRVTWQVSFTSVRSLRSGQTDPFYHEGII